MDAIIHVDQMGLWGWEILDQEGVYLRSSDIFVTEQDARADLNRSAHLIMAQLTIH